MKKSLSKKSKKVIEKHRCRAAGHSNEVYWQMKELRWYGVDMAREARVILSNIKVSKLEGIAA